jgi:hypothetical protein
MNIKLAAYLDEAGDDPAKSCEVLVSKNISGVCLRRAWCRDISSMPDNALGILDSTLSQHKLISVLMCTEIGCVPLEKLAEEEVRLTRAMQVCKYLKCKSIRIGLGLPSTSGTNYHFERWIATAMAFSVSYDISLLFEPDYDSHVSQPAAVAIFLNKHRRFSLLYDPAVLIMRTRIDPFVKFWSLLKSRVSFIDIHDYKIGDAAKPAGYGNGQLDLTVSDAIASKFSGWFCLEPGLGKRYGDISGKEKTFLHAYDSFESLLQRTQLPKIL